MSYAVLFPGQGNQRPDMLPWLESVPSSAVVATMTRMLGDWRERSRDEHWLSSNEVAQVLVTGTSLATWAALAPLLPGPPAIVAGYSVGELAAFACAGVFDPAQALELAMRRAGQMDRCVDGLSTGLLSVSGVTQAVVAQACTGLKLECAIHVADDHGIYAGENATLQEAHDRLAHLGAKSKRLSVQIASHSSWMHGAATAFAHTLQRVRFNSARCPVTLNASGTTTRHAAALRQALSRQIETTVHWSACMRSIAERRVSCVIEVGAGSALSRMWAAHHPEVPARAVEDFRDPRAVASWVARHGDRH
jgi:[acyl-carrier-protein] S-malonyltransferase